MEPKEFEAWGRAVAEHSAALIVAEIPAAQLPEPGKTVRAVLGRRGYISRYVHFRRPDRPVGRAVWVVEVPARQANDFSPTHDRDGAGLLQDSSRDLSSSRFAAGMTR